MITSLSSNVLLVSFPWRNFAISSSSTHFNFTPISQTRLFSSSIDVAKEVEKDDSFTVSYLINSCGLSPESAKLASKHVQLKDASKADSVLDCLRNYGFSDAHIQKAIRGYPTVLLLTAEKILKPKMEFFLSIGVKGEDLVAIMCRNPKLLSCSLDGTIIPCYNFFKRELVHDKLVVKSLKSNSWVWTSKLEKNVVPNLKLLKKVGVPESRIQLFFIYASGYLRVDHAKFSKRVKEVIDMGFDPLKFSFIQAFRSWPTKSNWERKAQLCRSWGWSDLDMVIAFKKNPDFIQTSEEKVTAVMDFMVNKMGFDPSVIAGYSDVFKYSLEKKIIPRCSVLRVLMLKGLLRKGFPLTSFIAPNKIVFLDMYVFKYLEQVPELLDIYEGEVDLEELGFGFEEKLDTKLEQLAL